MSFGSESEALTDRRSGEEERAAPAERKHGPAYLEPGGLYMLRRRLSCHMNIDPLIECFGREAAEYAVQTYKRNPLISVEPMGEIVNDEVSAYIRLADSTILNEMLVLFGYARYDGKSTGAYAEKIQAAEEQSKKGNTGLWRVCGETEQVPRPCFLFSDRDIDSATRRAILEAYPDGKEVSVSFLHAYYDSVQHEVVVTRRLYFENASSGQRVMEYYRLSDCLRDRSEVFNIDD